MTWETGLILAVTCAIICLYSMALIDAKKEYFKPIPYFSILISLMFVSIISAFRLDSAFETEQQAQASSPESPSEKKDLGLRIINVARRGDYTYLTYENFWNTYQDDVRKRAKKHLDVLDWFKKQHPHLKIIDQQIIFLGSKWYEILIHHRPKNQPTLSVKSYNQQAFEHCWQKSENSPRQKIELFNCLRTIGSHGF